MLADRAERLKAAEQASSYLSRIDLLTMKHGLGAAALILGLPLTAFAQSNVSITNFKADRVVGTDFMSTLANLISVFLLWAGVIAFIVVMYGGYLFLTAGGDTAAVSKARSTIIGAIIGIVIITMSYV